MKWLAKENGFVHVCGHRGHNIATPENTLTAFKKAKELGATTCEIDIVLTADDDIAVIHDLTVNRTTNGQGLVRSLTMAQLQTLDAGSFFGDEFAGEKIPSLRDVLEYAKGNLGLVIEIKERFNTEKITERLGVLLDEMNAKEEVIIISFDHLSLVRVKEIIPDIPTEGIIHARHVNVVAIAQKAKLDSLSIEVDMFHPDDARALHEAGIAIRCHLPRPEEIKHFQQYGIDIETHVGRWLEQGLMDSLSGDDVGYLRQLLNKYQL
jgi:glycerophosphoryl diester phosphodiesterase